MTATFITDKSTRPRPEAVEIGKILEEHPPRGWADRYNAKGWSFIAEAVLIAQDRVRG